MPVSKTATTIINDAADLIGAKAAEEALEAADFQRVMRELNRMMKQFQATGAHVWSEEEATVFTQPGQHKYIFGESSTDHATESYTATNLTNAATTGASTVVLDDESSISANDFIGIELDSGSLFWTTVVSLSPVTLTDTLPSDCAAANRVYYYTTKIDKPLKIPFAVRVQQAANTITPTEIMMESLGRNDYWNLPNKESQGDPVQYYYQPRKVKGDFYIWSVPNSLNTRVKISYQREIDIFADTDDVADVPDEWMTAIVYNLAVRIAPMFGQEALPSVQQTAQSAFDTARSGDQGDSSVYLQFKTFKWGI